jgi:hypothetical protein
MYMYMSTIVINGGGVTVFSYNCKVDMIGVQGHLNGAWCRDKVPGAHIVPHFTNHIRF